jgi:hypothetical protein
MTKLRIIWRNPNPNRRPQRWQTLERGLGRTLYVVQQLVIPEGEKGYWTTTASLEVLRGGRAIA